MSRRDPSIEPGSLETLVHVLAERARVQPEQTAFVFVSDRGRKDARLSYAETLRQARKIAAFLQSVARPGARIVLLYPPGPEYVTAFLGCLYAGMIAIPLYPPRHNQNALRVEEVFRNAGPTAAITSAELYAGIAGIMRGAACYAEVALYPTSDLPEELAGEAGAPVPGTRDLAFLQYTSGSTSAPKGVMVSHENLMANSRALASAFAYQSEHEVFTNWIPPYHDMGLIGGVLQALYAGFPSVMLSPVTFIMSPVRWLEAITQYRATIAGGPNFAYDLCVDKVTPAQMANLDLRSWRIACNGAEPIRAATMERFAEAFAPAGFRVEQFFPCYGMAEATLIVTGCDPATRPVVQRVDREAVAMHEAAAPSEPSAGLELVGCGRVVPDHRVCIVDPVALGVLADRKIGEIWTAGPSVAGGYWNNQDATRASFGAHTADGDGPFLRTGDLGFLDGGELFVCGRIKDMIIVRGRNHYPQDLEATVAACHPLLRKNAGAAFGVEVDGEERVVVVQEVERGARGTDWSQVFPAICQAVAEVHDVGLHAIVLIRISSLPKTSSGKVQRHAAHARFVAGELDVVARWGKAEPADGQPASQIADRPGDVPAADAPAPAGEPAAKDPGQSAAARAAAPAAEPVAPRDDVSAVATTSTDAEAYARVCEVLVRRVAAELKLSPDRLDVERPLAQYGMDSRAAISVAGDLERELGRPLSPTLLYDYPTIPQLARYLCGDAVAPGARPAPVPAERLGPRQEPVAVIGVGCRFPGAAGPAALWALLSRGEDAIRAMPVERRELLGLADRSAPLWGGYLDGLELFDPAAFGISPHEADLMDPQQRLVLEVACEALGAAGIAPSRLAGSRTGVFVGISTRDYERVQAAAPETVYMVPGNASSIAANRLSYALDLRGPSVAVDSACSSSLVAVHEACVALGTWGCDVALAGGVNVLLDPSVTRMLANGGLMAVDGHCKAFDDSADGYVRSEGCGVVVLKRLADAERAGDPILAVIRGSAVNHNGRSNGMLAPSGPAQEAVIREALERAGAAASEIGYMEAHGTGTALGDPIELAAVQRALGPGRGSGARCGVGSIKANVGHMEAAAGIGGLVKIVLMLQHGQIPPHRMQRLNPRISLDAGFYIPGELAAWTATQAPRRAGVSSFGFGGTNAHVIVEQAAASSASVERPAGQDARVDAVAGPYAAGVAPRGERVEPHGVTRPGLPLPRSERRRCWFTDSPAPAGSAGKVAPAAPAVTVAMTASGANAGTAANGVNAGAARAQTAREDEILAQLQALVAAHLKTAAAEVDPALPLLELGVDSLMLMDVLVDVNTHFGVELAERELFERLPTLGHVARDIHARMPPVVAVASAPPPVELSVPSPAPAIPPVSCPAPVVEPVMAPNAQPAVVPGDVASVVARMMEQHTQVMTMALRLLGAQLPDGPRGETPAEAIEPDRTREVPAAGVAEPVAIEPDRTRDVPAGGSSAAGRADRAIVPVPRDRAMAMSFAQERMWFLHQLQPESPAYNMSAAVHVTGTLDVAVIADCVHEVVCRHEILRTTFAAVDGIGVQIITPPEAVARAPMREIDLTALPAGERAARLERLARDEARTPFDLVRGPLLRTRVVRLTPDEQVGLFYMHHIVSDGWSLSLFVRELAAAYEARVAGRASPLAALPVHYADYAQWQRQRLQGERFDRELGYWTQALAGIPDLLALPTDRPRPAVRSYHGDRVAVTLPRELTEALKALGQRHGATLFMTLLAGFQVLLARYSGQRDVVVGSPVAGRDHAELRELIGLFVNTLALRARVGDGVGFDELLRQVRATVLEAFAHREVPFERIVDALGVRRDLSRTPVVQVLFVLQNLPFADRRLAGLSLREYEIANHTAKLDLTLTLWEAGGALSGSLEYDTELFDRATIERMARHLRAVLAAAVAAPGRSIDALALSDEPERAELAAWNATDLELGGPGCLHELIAAQAARTPGQLAVVFEDHRIAYAELLARASRLAHHLRALGVGPDTVAAVILERSVELVVAVLGVLQAGAAYLPLDPEHPAERLAFAVRDAGARVVVTRQALAGRPGAHAARVVCLDTDGAVIAAAPDTAPDTGCTADHLAYVIYTSGSTGVPKGVENSHRGIVNRLRWHQRRFPLGTGDKVLHKTPCTFDVSVWELLWPLMTGATLVLARPGGHGDPQYLAGLIEAEAITCVHFVPSMLRAFLEVLEPVRVGAGARWPALVWLVCSGEALSPELRELCFARLGRATELHNLYGPTEAAVDVTHWHCRPDDGGDDDDDGDGDGGAGAGDHAASVPIGRPIANTQIHLLDRALRPVPVGVPGELCIGGVQVARGYRGRPALTAERFVPDPFARAPGARLYRTGDLARHRPAGGGAIEFLGRIDFQVKLRGLRIEPGEIEAALRGIAGVRDAVVVVRDELLAAYLIAAGPDGPPGRDGLREQLRAQLPAYMVPDSFTVLEAFPLTTSGKLDRGALPAPAGLAGAGGAAPITPVEEILAGIWRDLLGTREVGRLDDFFARGGHSLLAIQVATRAGHALGAQVPVRVIFERPVLADLAAYVQQAERRRHHPPPIVPVPRGQPLPLSFSQEQLWMAQVLEPASGALNMSAGLLLRGPLDLDILRRALAELVSRHEILRMRVVVHDGRPGLAIAAAVPLDLPEDDLRPAGAATAPAAELARRLDAHAAAPFDLERGPLFRMACFRISDDEVVLALALHHITCDGWSINLLAGELAALYDAFSAGRPSPLAALAVQYPDVAAWQRAWLTGAVLDEHVAHFAGKLGGELPVLALPLDRPRSARTGSAGQSLVQPIDPELGQALEQAGQALGATLNMVLMAGFLALLHRFSRQDDLILGTTVAGRARPETEPLVGCFINHLVLRFDLAARPSFRELVAQVRRETLEAYDYQALPFDKLLEARNPRREPGVSPLFQVVFGMQTITREALALTGLEVEWLRPGSLTARYDLTVWVEKRPDRLGVEWTYRTELFDAATIRELAASYEQLLRRAVRDPDLGLLALAIDPPRAGDGAAPPAPKRALAEALRKTRRRSGAADEAG